MLNNLYSDKKFTFRHMHKPDFFYLLCTAIYAGRKGKLLQQLRHREHSCVQPFNFERHIDRSGRKI